MYQWLELDPDTFQTARYHPSWPPHQRAIRSEAHVKATPWSDDDVRDGWYAGLSSRGFLPASRPPLGNYGNSLWHYSTCACLVWSSSELLKMTTYAAMPIILASLSGDCHLGSTCNLEWLWDQPWVLKEASVIRYPTWQATSFPGQESVCGCQAQLHVSQRSRKLLTFNQRWGSHGIIEVACCWSPEGNHKRSLS